MTHALSRLAFLKSHFNFGRQHMKNYQPPASTALPTESLVPGAAPALEVNITAALASVDVMHHGRKVAIMRNQNQSNTVNPDFAKIPWDKLDIGKSGSTAVEEILEKQLSAKRQNGFWNFDGAKTLVMFCNGSWCGQSPTNIKDLLKIGYPAHKIFWYRGGMQDWENLGLTTVKPESE
jgi:hypothetical protein